MLQATKNLLLFFIADAMLGFCLWLAHIVPVVIRVTPGCN